MKRHVFEVRKPLDFERRVLAAHHLVIAHQELRDQGLRDHPGAVRDLSHLLDHPDQGVGDRHARHLVLGPVAPSL